MNLSLKNAGPLERLRDGIVEDLQSVEHLEEIAPILRAGLERADVLRKRGENSDGLSPRTGTFGAD